MTRSPSPTVRTKSLTGGASRPCPVRVKWYSLMSGSARLPLRLDGSAFAGDRVSAGVGVEARVVEVEETGELPSLASRIFVGSVVRISWILSSRDSDFLCLLG